MISGGSCDTEDWSNDAENSGINYILKYIKIENLFSIATIFHKITVCNVSNYFFQKVHLYYTLNKLAYSLALFVTFGLCKSFHWLYIHYL